MKDDSQQPVAPPHTQRLTLMHVCVYVYACAHAKKCMHAMLKIGYNNGNK